MLKLFCMEKKVKIYSCSPNSLPSNIEIKQLNNTAADNLKLIALFKKVFNNPDYLDSLIVSLQSGTYTTMLGAFNTETNSLVGGCLLLDKAVAVQQKYNSNFPLNHTMLIDFLFVDPQFQHSKIGTNLINSAYQVCGENGYKQIELLCEIENSLTQNVYDKNDMLRTGVAAINSISKEPYYFVFNASINRNVRQFGKVLYLALTDAYNSGEYSYFDYKQRLQDGYVPSEILTVRNIDSKTFGNIVNSPTFDMFDEVMESIIDSGTTVIDVSEQLGKILKSKKQGLIAYNPASYNGLGCGSSIIEEYLTDRFTTAQVSTVKKVLDETKNRMINDYILEEYTKK